MKEPGDNYEVIGPLKTIQEQAKTRRYSKVCIILRLLSFCTATQLIRQERDRT